MSFSQEDIRFIRSRVEETLGRPVPENVTVKEGEGLTVTSGPEGAVIAAESRAALARGLTHLARAAAEGRKEVRIREKRHFEHCGPYLDLSRNGVMTVDAVKKYIDFSACLGLDMAVLYTEDTYEVPGYPYMGYLRGRLTGDEWRAIDEHGARMGVEVIPSMQALGHMENFLQWRGCDALRDQEDILLADSEETFAFLEAAVSALRGYVRTGTLFIGMDEAETVGLGKYYQLHGARDRFSILERHLRRMIGICEKYGFKPVIWSDMFYKLGSPSGKYYDKDNDIPDEVVASLPRAEMCYWDYYHMEEDWYDRMLKGHERFGPDTSFAGGIWTWSGFLPHPGRTRATMEPALRACLRHGTKRVTATMWGDDGSETSPFLALHQLPLFSEAYWRGEVPGAEEVGAIGAFLTGLSAEAYESFDLFYPDDGDDRVGKALIWCDPMYPIGPEPGKTAAAGERARKALRILEKEPDRDDVLYARALFEVCALKADLMPRIAEKYRAGDRAGMRDLAETEVPRLKMCYDELIKRHRVIWEQAYKRNGWEVMALRYGAVRGRLEDVGLALKRWADGELKILCELEEERLDPARARGNQFYRALVSPMFNQ